MPGPVEQACKVGATLGEGPYWSEGEGKLWFVDIKEQKIHRFDPGADRLESWNAPAQPGWIFPTDSGRMVAGLQSGIHMFDPASGSFELLAAPEASDGLVVPQQVDVGLQQHSQAERVGLADGRADFGVSQCDKLVVI